jgi:DNA-directed RNA polymerase specialized sigma24 family protein
MRRLTNNTHFFSSPYLSVVDNDISTIGTRIGKHEDLLVQIMSGLGLNKIQSDEILKEVRLQAKRQYREYPGTFPFKVWLSKILVRKCIFKISEDFFNGLKDEQTKSPAFGSYSTEKNIFATCGEKIPLSFWVVYLLHHHIGFTEKEIAEILNTSPLSVRTRLNKAESRCQNHRMYLRDAAFWCNWRR